MVQGQDETGQFGRGDEALLRFYFGDGQVLFLRSSHPAMVRRLERKAFPKNSPEIRESRAAHRAWMREQIKAGVSEGLLPDAPEITAQPIRETVSNSSVEVSDQELRDWERIGEASGKLRTLEAVLPGATAILEAFYGDKGLEWPAAFFRHGALYHLDKDAVRFLGKLKRADEDGRQARLRRNNMPPDMIQPLSGPELLKAERDRAVKGDDMETLRELERFEATAKKLLGRIAAAWNRLEAAQWGGRDVHAMVLEAFESAQQMDGGACD